MKRSELILCSTVIEFVLEAHKSDKQHFVQRRRLAAPQLLLLLCVSGVVVGQVKAAGAVVIR